MLNGIGLANVAMNCSGGYLIIGLNQGFGSLGARAFGANTKPLLNDYVAKSLLTVGIVSFFFGLFLAIQKPILEALG